jgi:hypothetical protein
MNPLTKHKKTVILPLVVLLVLIVFAGLIVMYRVARPVKGDQSVQAVEKLQRSVTEDPAVKGEFANGWLVPHAGAGLPQPTPTESETLEWVKLFKNTQAPRIVEENLSPGARRTVQLQITGPSGLFGSARWVGAIRPLRVIIALNGSTLATGTAYHVGSNRGGSYLQTRTTTGGLATMSVTNTSGVNAKVRIVFTATGL